MAIQTRNKTTNVPALDPFYRPWFDGYLVPKTEQGTYIAADAALRWGA